MTTFAGVMNRTQTKMGYRMLKASILQPSTGKVPCSRRVGVSPLNWLIPVPHVIENRLNVIEGEPSTCSGADQYNDADNH